MFVRSVRALAVATALVFAVGLVAHVPAAEAKGRGRGKVEKKFGGKILVSDKKFPSSAKSESAYIAKLKKNSKAKFWENKEKKEWKIYFAAFFRKPLNDLEYTVKLYDLTDGQALKSSFEQYTDSSGQTSLLSYIVLERQHFGVNRKIMMTIESRGRVIAAGKFHILGEAEKYTGKVDFSEGEE